MKILLASLAENGSVKTHTGVGRYYHSIRERLEKENHEIFFFAPKRPVNVDKLSLYNTFIPLLSNSFAKDFAKVFEKVKPDAIHIQGESGPGLAARAFCIKENIPYSSAYHTNFAIAMNMWLHVPHSWTWRYLRWFYRPASLIHTHTERLSNSLKEESFTNPIAIFPPGVDTKLFYPDPNPALFANYKRPYFIYAGRISKEKNIEAFLDLDLPGTKFVIGSGPEKPNLEKKYKGKAVFFTSEHLRPMLSNGDVFVFPSKFETFGLVLLEALACGLPIAAYPVMGPLDVIEQGVNGYALENLQEAALRCLTLKNKDAFLATANRFTWEKTADNFVKNQIIL
jgi:glycosyltransferase involved in cell wall biosynthesis